MSDWVVFPECLAIDVDVVETFRIPDPLWPGLGFFLAFVIGGIIGALLAKCCFKDYLKMRSRDEEEATLIAQGVPMHMRGRKSIFPTPEMYSDKETLRPAVNEFDSPTRGGAVTPSNITVDTDASAGLSDALIKPTGDSAVAEITHQDVSNFLLIEEQLRIRRVESLVTMVRIHLNKLIISNKMSEEDAERVVNVLKKKCEDIIEHNKCSEAAAIAALNNDPKVQKNSLAMQTEVDKQHASSIQKTNWELSAVESDIPHYLASVESLSEEDIDGLMKKLKHQLATREHKVNDETRRQVQALEDRLARRRELAEQNRLAKQATTDIVKAKVENQSNNLQRLINNSTITEQEKDAIMREYEKDMWRVHNNNEQEMREQDQLLHEKLAKKRKNRLKKLSSQQSKGMKDLHGKLVKSSNHADMNGYDEYLEQQHDEYARAIAELDEEEAKQLNGIAVTTAKDFSSQLQDVDDQLCDTLANNPAVDEDTVKKIIKLHKAEMKEFNLNRQREQQVMEAKLQQKLAEKKLKREENAKESQVAFQSLKVQQEEMVHKVLQNQADLTEEAATRIMEEHKRNMETMNSQLSFSRLRQEKQLEERLAQRKAKLAEKEQARQQAGEKQSEKLKKEMEEERLQIKRDNEEQLANLRKNIQEETQQALDAQELQISQLIGQLEVGQARRKNILQKQDKLISELENQLAGKVGENPKGYTTTNELMQKHYGQVEALNNSLQTTRERQEQALQERLEQKQLIREREIKEQMKAEALKEVDNIRARGAGAASNILLDMMLQQRHERAMEELEKEMKVELQRSRDQMNEELNAEMMAALSDEGKSFMAEMAANSGLSNEDLSEAMQNAAKSIQANDQTVKKLAKEMRVRVKTAKGGEKKERPPSFSDTPGRLDPVQVHKSSRALMQQLQQIQRDGGLLDSDED